MPAGQQQADADGEIVVEEKPKPKPKEYVEMGSLAEVLKSVIDFKFRENDRTKEENKKEIEEEKDQKKAEENKEAITDPLSIEANRNFCLQFLTRFVLRGYCGQNKVDITESDFPNSDKNNLKWAGIVKENIEMLRQE